jgi:hypothetical protein
MSDKSRPNPLKPLAVVLIVKIAFTALFWSTPLLFFQKSWFRPFGIPVPDPVVFVRLLGAAYLALLVGYAFGLAQAQRGTKPTGVIWTGAVSNGLASGILSYHGLTGAWDTWDRPGPALMWGSAIATLGITVGLLYFGRPWKRAQD